MNRVKVNIFYCVSSSLETLRKKVSATKKNSKYVYFSRDMSLCIKNKVSDFGFLGVFTTVFSILDTQYFLLFAQAKEAVSFFQPVVIL